MSAPPPVAIVAASESVATVGVVSITAETAPGTACVIAVGELGAGVSAAALAGRVADASGRVLWTWTLGDVAPGSYTVTVTCGGGSASATVVVRG